MTEAGNPRNVSYTRTGEKFEVRQSGVRVQNLFIAHIDIAEGKTRFASARCDSLPRPTTFHAAVAVERPFLHQSRAAALLKMPCALSRNPKLAQMHGLTSNTTYA